MPSRSDLPSTLLDSFRRDLRTTLGPAVPEDELAAAIDGQRDFADSPADYVQRVVDAVQQSIHDLFIDTSWPPCPRHPRHPLWYHDGAWWCGRERVAIAPLGGLSASPGRADDSRAR